MRFDENACACKAFLDAFEISEKAKGPLIVALGDGGARHRCACPVSERCAKCRVVAQTASRSHAAEMPSARRRYFWTRWVAVLGSSEQKRT